jgi:hypothetical protein
MVPFFCSRSLITLPDAKLNLRRTALISKSLPIAPLPSRTGPSLLDKTLKKVSQLEAIHRTDIAEAVSLRKSISKLEKKQAETDAILKRILRGQDGSRGSIEGPDIGLRDSRRSRIEIESDSGQSEEGSPARQEIDDMDQDEPERKFSDDSSEFISPDRGGHMGYAVDPDFVSKGGNDDVLSDNGGYRNYGMEDENESEVEEEVEEVVEEEVGYSDDDVRIFTIVPWFRADMIVGNSFTAT